MPRTPSEHSLASSAGADLSWANTADWSARTQPAREARFEKFRQQVDPEGLLDPEERERRAQCAFRSHMKMIALRSAQARRRRREQCTQESDRGENSATEP